MLRRRFPRSIFLFPTGSTFPSKNAAPPRLRIYKECASRRMSAPRILRSTSRRHVILPPYLPSAESLALRTRSLCARLLRPRNLFPQLQPAEIRRSPTKKARLPRFGGGFFSLSDRD